MKPIKSPVLAASLLAVSAASSQAATYANDFNGTAFTTETADADWTVGSGGYQNVYTGNDKVSSASVAVAGVSGTSFTVSSQFTVNSTNAPNSSLSTLGFGVLGLNSGFSGADTGSAYYLADFAYANSTSNVDAGRLRILSLGDGSGYTNTPTTGNFDGNSTNLAIQTGVTYTLRLTGTYNGSGHLALTLGLFDSTGTIQYGTSATATDTSPLTGTNFGYRNRTATNSVSASSLNATFDNFSVANVPEPSAAIFGAFGALTLLRRRR